MLYCPNCGAELPQEKWRYMGKYQPPEAEVTCPNGHKIAMEDRTAKDQEGLIEIIFH